jgi:NADPH:quinone reductase-like Zn-dependent oxidoreductase
MLHWKPFNRPDLNELERLVASGAVKPAIDRRFAIDQVVDALTYVHEGYPRGKVLILKS